MKKLILILVISLTTMTNGFGQIIADHSVVDLYDNIPEQWIDSVKTMFMALAGRSHAGGYHRGLTQLENSNSTYSVNVATLPESYSSHYLRYTSYTWGNVTTQNEWLNSYGQTDFFSSEMALNHTKIVISQYKAVGAEADVFGFGWCWNELGGDYITDYLNAMQLYIDYCTDSITTKMIYTTQPVDGPWGDTYAIFQGNERIRAAVKANSASILFDYADILCYDNGSDIPYTNTDGVNTWPVITPANDEPELVAHISAVGELRLAKALWWMLARIAGWDGSTGGSTDTTPPTAPSNLAPTFYSETSVSLSWNSSTDNVGVSGYRVYRSASLLGTTSSLNYTDNTVDACTDYSYSVSAIDAAGNESAQSTAQNVNTTIQAPDANITQPGCIIQTGSIEVTSPAGTGIEYSIDNGSSWVSSATFSGLIASTTYTVNVRNTSADPGCTNSSDFILNAIPSSPSAPTVSNSSPVNECPELSIDLTSLVTSTTPTGGSTLYKTSDDPLGTDVSDPAGASAGNYFVFYESQEGCYSTGTEVVVSIDPCPADITPSLIVTPNIIHGTTTFNLFVRVTELNAINTSGSIVVNIPKHPKWTLPDGFQPLLTELDGTALNNSDWSYSSDDINHIFTSTNPIPAGGYSVIGVRISFSPDHSRGSDTVTAQIVSGGGGEVRVSNNSDSERLDYFQE